MGWLSDLGKGLVGTVAGGLVGNWFDSSNNAKTGQQNLATSKELFKYQNSNKYQFMVDDLNKAGLNPMLAVTGMQGSAGGVVNGSSRSSDEQGINNATATRKALQIQKEQLDIERDRAVAERLEKEANAEMAKALANRYNTLTPTENAKTVAETKFINQNIMKTSAEIDKIYSDIMNSGRITQAQVDNLIAQTRHLRVVTGNESINYDLLLRIRDSKSEAMKRELLEHWYWQVAHNTGYLFDLVTGSSGVGLTTAGKFGFKVK